MNNNKVNAEVLSVLLALGDKYINKLPSTVMQYLIQNSDKNLMPNIDANKRIEEQNISKDARAFLTMLKLKYWCKSEDEKKELLSLLGTNEKKQQEEMNVKYNPNNLFNNTNN